MGSLDFSLINLIILNICAFLFAVLSIISVMPVTLEERYGPKAWRLCYRLRIYMSIFISIMVINMIFWLWIPFDELSWVVHPDHFISIFIGIVIVIPCTIMLYFSVKHGGEEHLKPKKETKLHGGIYKYIRHPGVVGEMPWYIALGFFVNSVFLVLWAAIFTMIYVPFYIYFEEKDLMKRFGEEYLQYRNQTGALIPKFWKRKD